MKRGTVNSPYYEPVPGAADRRAELAMLVDNAITRLNLGEDLTREQTDALHDAYRSSCRATRPPPAGAERKALTVAYHELRKARIEAARRADAQIRARRMRDEATMLNTNPFASVPTVPAGFTI